MNRGKEWKTVCLKLIGARCSITSNMQRRCGKSVEKNVDKPVDNDALKCYNVEKIIKAMTKKVKREVFQRAGGCCESAYFLLRTPPFRAGGPNVPLGASVDVFRECCVNA